MCLPFFIAIQDCYTISAKLMIYTPLADDIQGLHLDDIPPLADDIQGLHLDDIHVFDG